ncbi:MAG TPA: MATE family efflux transporter, partial [Rhodocyclaceae bacterium]|nr:MATE family efflux transporter [Rhodocyclaceae bacterium]
FPMGLQYLAEGGALSVAGVLIGLLGAAALAANQIVFSVASVVYMLPLGMAGAVAVRIGQAVGAGESLRVRPIGMAAIGLVTLWTVAISVLLLAGGERIARTFVDDATVIGIASSMFVAVGLMQVFDGVQSVSLGALRALLDNRWPTAVTLGAYWALALPLGWLLAVPLGQGAAGFWAGFAVALSIAAVLLLRLIAVLVAIGIGASAFAYLFTRDRRYLAFALRLARYALIVALVFLALLALERVLAPAFG